MLTRIEKVAVIGSGIMGGGIAALCASAGIETLLLDIVPFDLKTEEKDDPKARNRLVQKGLDGALNAKPPLFMDNTADLNYLRIGNLDDDFEKLSACDLIIEVVVEDIKIKQELYMRLEKIREPGTIITTNTSGLPIDTLSEKMSTEMKQHFFGTHFFNPVRYMKLLEIIPGKDSLPEVQQFIADWGEKVLGKGIVWAKDTPNFVGNRIGVQLICKAFELLENENIPPNTLDALYGSELGMPKTGIFALADLVGLDTIGHLAENSYNLLKSDEERDLYKVPGYVTTMLEKKMFGKKTKDAGGFYKTTVDLKTWKRNKQVLDINKMEHVDFDRSAKPDCVNKAKEQVSLAEKQKTILFDDSPESAIAWKLMASSLIYAIKRIPEIADTIVEIDNAMKWGYAWETGPFEIWDNIGIENSLQHFRKLNIEIPEPIDTMLKSGNKTFYQYKNNKRYYYDFKQQKYLEIVLDEKSIQLLNLKAADKEVLSNNAASLIDIGDGIFCLEFHTKMNAVNKDMIELNRQATEYVHANGIGLVIGNQAPGIPGAFCAGGDLKYMGELAKKKKWSEIDSFIKEAQSVILGSKYAPFPVVAAPYGMTLGGGAEICLASDRIVAHADLYMGLVEISAGLLPAGGGCTNLWRKMSEYKPTNVTITNLGDYFVPCFRQIAMAKFSSSAKDARNMGFLGPKDRIVFNKDHLLGEAKKEVLNMVDNNYHPPAKTKIMVMGEEAIGMVYAEMFNLKNGGFITPHMEVIAKKILYVLSGGEVRSGQTVSEQYMLDLEREAFVELWKEENTQKMAEHILKTGKPLFL